MQPTTEPSKLKVLSAAVVRRVAFNRGSSGHHKAPWLPLSEPFLRRPFEAESDRLCAAQRAVERHFGVLSTLGPLQATAERNDRWQDGSSAASARTQAETRQGRGLLLRDGLTTGDNGDDECSIGSLHSQASQLSLDTVPAMRPRAYYLLRNVQRARRRKVVRRLKDDLDVQRTRALLRRIRDKDERPARAKARRRVLHRQRKMLVLIRIACFASVAESRFRRGLARRREQELRHQGARRIEQAYILSKNRRVWRRYARFRAALMDNSWLLRMGLRAWRRRRSADRVRTFLLEAPALRRNQAHRITKAFMSKVRLLQDQARAFLACKKARMAMLRSVWAEEEAGVLRDLERRIRRGRSMPLVRLSDADHTPEVRSLTRAVNRRALRWRQIHQSFDELIQSQVDKHRIETLTTDRLRPKPLPADVRDQELHELLREYRKTYMQGAAAFQRALEIARNDARKTGFTSEDIRRSFQEHAEGQPLVFRLRLTQASYDRPVFLMMRPLLSTSLTRPLREKMRLRYTDLHAKMYGDVVTGRGA
eukprot:scaffold207_cov267-Pinguiococcus_pyrenoidosus.AAC.25